MVVRVVQLFRQKFHLKEQDEALTIGGFILTYIVLAKSQYQLPHYIFVVFPLAALMVAKLLQDFFEGKFKALFKAINAIQIFTSTLLLLVALLLFVYVFKGAWLCYVIWVLGVGVWLLLLLKTRHKMFWMSVASMICLNIIATNHFYKRLLTNYQASAAISSFILKNNIPKDKLSMFHFEDPAVCLDFYTKAIVPRNDTLKPTMPEYLLTCNSGLDSLATHHRRYTTLYQGKMFKVSELTPEFINPITRDKALKGYYLIKLK